MNPVVLPWIVELVIVSWRSLTGTHFTTVKGVQKTGGGSISPTMVPSVQKVTNGVKRPPLPSEVLATFVVFGACAAIAEKDARVGQLLAWGFVVATALLFLGGPSPVVGATPGVTVTAPQGQAPIANVPLPGQRMIPYPPFISGGGQ